MDERFPQLLKVIQGEYKGVLCAVACDSKPLRWEITRETEVSMGAMRSKVAETETVPLTYSAAEAAELLGVSKNHFYDCLNRGEIPGIKVGQTWRIPRKAFHEFIESSCGAGSVREA